MCICKSFSFHTTKCIDRYLCVDKYNMSQGIFISECCSVHFNMLLTKSHFISHEFLF